MSINEKRQRENSSQKSSVSYQAFVRNLAEASPLRTLDSLILEDDFILDGPTIVSEFALFLTILRIPGPCDVFSNASPLGVGAHFTVSKQNIIAPAEFTPRDPSPQNSVQPAAVKRPKFLLDADHRLDLSDSCSSSRQVRSMMLEITALCHPRLRGHPNLVKLLAWGSVRDEWHVVPFVALEVAEMDLAALMCSDNALLPFMKLDLMQDVACGLDAIHDVGLFHGDLKPANVLIFVESQHWVAKLADFGGAANVGKDGFWEGGGTVGWRAPEVRELYDSGKPLDLSVLDRADNYSFGLLLWSIFLREEAMSPNDERETNVEEVAVADLHGYTQGMPALLIDILENSFTSLLKTNPCLREKKLEVLLDDCVQERNDRDLRAGSQQRELEEIHQTWTNAPQVKWDTPEISETITPVFKAAFIRGQTMPAGILHSLIVRLLSQGPDLDFQTDDRDLLLSLVCAAARQGQRPSKFMIFRVHEYFGVKLPPDLSSAKLSWIAEGVAAGSFFLRIDLQQMDAEIYATSVAKFRASGGFNSAYPDSSRAHSFRNFHEISQDDCHEVELSNSVNDHGDNVLHIAAALDQETRLSTMLCRSSPAHINAVNDLGETPLYRACKAGSTGSVLQLLSHGADASIRTSEDGPGCLHWIFHFEKNDIDHIVDQLVVHGAGVDVQSRQVIIIDHPPFNLPVGTALQWAVEMSVTGAVSALLRHGANPCLRDGRDPYEYNEGVRHLDRISPPSNTSHSIAENPTMGLNAFDLAVQNLDITILQMLLSKESVHGVASQVDEEGYSALHRLDAGNWLRTRQRTRIWKLFFKGSRQRLKETATLTINLLRDHGFQLDQLTNPQKPVSKRIIFRRLTPLMMAVEMGTFHTTEALIEAGANIDFCNDTGRTALHAVPSRYNRIPKRQSVMISILLRSNPEINVQDVEGQSPLAMAAKLSAREVGLAFLERGANICVPGGTLGGDGYGQNVIAFFCRCKVDEISEHDEWMTMILNKFVLPHLSGRDIGLAARVREEVLTNAGVNGSNFLHFAARAGLAKCCRLLLEQGLVNCNQLRSSSKRRTRNGVRGLVKQYRTPLDETLSSAKSSKRREATRFSEKGFFLRNV